MTKRQKEENYGGGKEYHFQCAQKLIIVRSFKAI